MTAPPKVASRDSGVDKRWLWAMRISVLVSGLACVPLLVDSLIYGFVLAAYLVLGGLLFGRPGKRTFIAAVVVSGLAFFFLGLPQALLPGLGFSWGSSLVFTLASLSLALTATEAQSRLEDSEKLPHGGTGDTRWV